MRANMINNLIRKEKGPAQRADLTKVQVECISHIGGRESQQDAFGISDYRNEAKVREKGILALLSDGMGGLNGGERASLTAVDVCFAYFDSTDFELAPWQELLHMTAMANRMVLRGNEKSGEESGATLIGTWLTGQGLYFVSVGDSSLCLLRRGGLIRLNRPQIYARTLDTEEAFGAQDAEEAFASPERNALTAFIGQQELKEADFVFEPVALLRDDTVLIMSDGVYKTLTEEEIVLALSHTSLQEGLAGLQQMILQKDNPNQDNFTALCLRL